MKAASFHKTSIDALLHHKHAGATPYRAVLGDVSQKLVVRSRNMLLQAVGDVRALQGCPDDFELALLVLLDSDVHCNDTSCIMLGCLLS